MRYGFLRALLFILAAGALFAVAGCGGDGGQDPAPTIRPEPNKTFGDQTATVTITEYFDYR